MQSFKHPNVMSLIGVCENLSGGPAVVMPFMANGSVLDYLKKNRKNLVLDAKAKETMVCSLHTVKCNGVESASLPNITTFMCYYKGKGRGEYSTCDNLLYIDQVCNDLDIKCCDWSAKGNYYNLVPSM